MIRDLVINVSLLISFISIANHIMREKELGISTPIKIKFIAGMISGMLGITLIFFGFHPTANIVIDFRNIVLTMSAIYGGTLPVVICGLLISTFQIIYFGLTHAAIIAATATLSMCASGIIVSKLKTKIWIRWGIASIFNTIIISISLGFLLNGSSSKLPELFITYWISSALVSILIYHYVNYSLEANKLFRKLKKESIKDFLTGLNNVRSFDRLFNEIMETSKKKNEPFSLLMIDIDFFKKVNDTYGHHQGDIVLRELGKVLIENTRSFDIVSRNGGEEFTVILLDCFVDQAEIIAERIRKSVEKTDFVLSHNTKIKITVSIGIASYPDITRNQESLLELADTALYAAKRTGRNKVVLAEAKE